MLLELKIPPTAPKGGGPEWCLEALVSPGSGHLAQRCPQRGLSRGAGTEASPAPGGRKGLVTKEMASFALGGRRAAPGKHWMALGCRADGGRERRISEVLS